MGHKIYVIYSFLRSPEEKRKKVLVSVVYAVPYSPNVWADFNQIWHVRLIAKYIIMAHNDDIYGNYFGYLP